MLDNEHEAVFPPASNCTLWRYMDLTKLLSLLENRRLYFPRADCFEDPFEGALSRASVDFIRDPSTNGGLPEHAIEQFIMHAEEQKKKMYISCWNSSDHESAAMWKLYLQSNEGVAIRTDHDSLCDALEKSDLRIRTTMVHYVDYDKQVIPMGNLLFPYVCKRLSFSHENELRAIIWSLEDVNKDKISDIASSVEIENEPEKLIKSVHVSPTAPNWFGNLVAQLIVRYSLDVPVERSSLYDRPAY